MEKSYRPYLFLGVGSSPLTEYRIEKGKAHIFKNTERTVPQETISLRESSAKLLERNLLQWLLGLGSIEITASNSQKMVWKNLKKVKSVKRDLDNWEEIEGNDKFQETLDEKSTDSAIQAIKVTPASDSELEIIRKEFKFYSPAQNSVRSAPLPKVGEEWKLERTLESGLLTTIPRKFPANRRAKKPSFYPNNIELINSNDRDKYLSQYHHEWSMTHHETRAVAWHPTKKLLATVSSAMNARLWDVEAGKVIREEDGVIQDLHDWDPLCWSYDGKYFISGTYLYNGITGECLYNFYKWDENSVNNFFGYSNYRYNARRGVKWEKEPDSNPSPFSSTINFSPWRPNSE